MIQYYEDSNEAILKEEDVYYREFIPLQLVIDECVKPIIFRLSEIEDYGDIIKEII